MLTINIETLVANVKGQKHEMKVEDLHIEGVRKILEYGFQRYLNDACGGDKTQEEIDNICRKRLHVLRTGEFGASRGPRVTDLRQKAEINILSAYLVKFMKKGEAAKFIKENGIERSWEFFFFKAYGSKIGKDIGRFTQDEKDNATFLIQKNMPAIRVKIEEERKRLEETANALDLDIEI